MMSNAPEAEPHPLDALAEANRPWWSRYSYHGEFPLSSVASSMLHLLLVVLVVLMAARHLYNYDRTPPAVGVVDVADDAPAPGNANDLPGGGLQSNTAQKPSETPPKDTPDTEIKKVEAPEKLDTELPVTDIGTEFQAIDQKMTEAESKLNSALDQLRDNQNAEGSGSEGEGKGGSGGSGRGARAARWILMFNTRSPNDYLSQLDGLGATVAFPRSGNDYLYIYNPSSNPRQETRSLAGESRINWVDRDARSVTGVCRVLDVPVAPFMLSFLPRELEDRLLTLELGYQGLREEQIRSTTFEVVQRGGGYDVIVARQIKR